MLKSEFRQEFCRKSFEGGSGAEPREGGYHPLPQFEVPPDPSPDWFVRELAYATSYGADTLGEGGIPPPEPPLLFSVIQGEAKYLLPQDPHFSVPEDEQNTFQTMGNVFPSKVPTVKIRIP